jgi:anti-sigma regulatory factor (Ser/Thr protein kinase)
MSGAISTPEDAADPGGGDPQPFRCSQNPADANTVSRARTAFGGWLQQHCPLTTTTAHDVLLAVNEALANAVEHAYAGTSGNVDLTASYDVAHDTLTATVEDYGHWRPPNATADPRFSRRGRGLVLMRALAEDTAIESSETGTRVSLTWHLLTRRQAPAG